VFIKFYSVEELNNKNIQATNFFKASVKIYSLSGIMNEISFNAFIKIDESDVSKAHKIYLTKGSSQV
jgi:hypothetical protein